MQHDEHRVQFDFEVEFFNGGGLQGQGFRPAAPLWWCAMPSELSCRSTLRTSWVRSQALLPSRDPSPDEPSASCTATTQPDRRTATTMQLASAPAELDGVARSARGGEREQAVAFLGDSGGLLRG